jgi:MoaA/NifB/PqqE/SkfB family radical SAM enzyme
MQMQPPFMVSYSITTKCNLKCKHCYSSSVDEAAPDELSTEEALHLVDDLSHWGISLLIIDGGEPLCRKDLLDVVRYASSKGIRTTIGVMAPSLMKLWQRRWLMQESWRLLSRLMAWMLRPMIRLEEWMVPSSKL